MRGGLMYAVATVVEARSYSRSSGATSWEVVTAIFRMALRDEARGVRLVLGLA